MLYSMDQIVPIIVATVAGMVIGGLWYSPLLFEKMWLALAFRGQTVDKAQMKKDAPKAMLGMFIILLFKVCILNKLFLILGVNDTLTGVQYGLWIGVGFIATTLADSVLFERKPVQLYLINAGYHMVSMTVIGAILGAW